MSYKHVLVALDLGTDVMNLVGKAANIAERDDALLSVIHVDMDIAEYYGGIMSFDFGQYKQTAHHESIVALQHQLAQIEFPIENRIVCTGAIEEEINRTIQTNHIDLLVMGHHKYNQLTQLFISVSAPLVSEMPCDILLVKV